MTTLDTAGPIAPSALHLGDSDLPWASTPGGVQLQVLQVQESTGLWVIRNRFDPGVEVQTHRHTGTVFGHTTSGSWAYKESDFLNVAGSYLFEPAGSVHTLVVPETNTEITEVLFIMYGANLNLDADGNVESVTDGAGVLAAYRAMCRAQGHDEPNVILI